LAERAAAELVDELARKEEDVTVRGAEDADVAEEAEAEERIIGGVDVGVGVVDFEDVAEDFGLAGLSHDEKKSSSSALALSTGGDFTASIPSTAMPCGNLSGRDQLFGAGR